MAIFRVGTSIARLLSVTATLALTPDIAALAQSTLGNVQGAEAAASSTELADIIVTAQRREERLQDVPISVAALSATSLAAAGITSTRDLGDVVPGLRIDANGVNVQPTIRGITTTLTGPTAEANIATYVDGVYQTTMTGALYELPDVKEVEVLKGPQGTLFGRNATGGAILINTLEPDLSKTSGLISASYGEYGSTYGKGYLTMPIVEDKVALGISALYDHVGSYIHDLQEDGHLIGHQDTALLRGKLRFLPWDGADFTLTAMYMRRDDDEDLKDTNYHGNNIAASLLPPSQIASEPYEWSANGDPRTLERQWSASLRGTIRLGPGTLSTTTAQVSTTGQEISDLDVSPAALGFHSESLLG